jgi:glycosyltransferase involved in cell wall biosynthesis
MFPNGVVSYIANLRPALQSHGFASSVVAAVSAPMADQEVANLSKLRKERKFHVKVLDRALHAWLPEQSTALRAAHTLTAALEAHRRKLPVHLIEMEEAFGIPTHVRRGIGLPIVVRLHGPWLVNGPALGVPLDDAFHRRVADEGKGITSAHAVSAPSLDVLERVRKAYDLTLPEAVVIPHAGPDVASSETWSAEHCEERSLLFVGRFDRHKGCDVVIEAFSLLAKADPRLTLVLAGPDRGITTNDGIKLGIAEYLEHAVPSIAVRSRIRVLSPQPSASLSELRRRAAMTIVASRYENCAMAAVEGMAFGSPLIVSAAGGNRELVRDGEAGLLCEPGSAVDLAAKIEKLLSEPELARSVAAGARREYESTLTPSLVAERTAKFYQRVLDRA